MYYLLTEKKSISVSHAKLWIQEMLAHLKNTKYVLKIEEKSNKTKTVKQKYYIIYF